MKWPLLLCAPLLLSACTMGQRLSEIGGPPHMSPTEDPTKVPGYKPLTMPMPPPPPPPQQADSLWRPGARSFFKDQRASRVGDIVTVVVAMNDAANMKNVTGAVRSSAENAGVPNLFGLENLMTRAGMTPSALIGLTSSNNNTGTGQIQRSETVTLRLAGVITQVLPNGNLVVIASQQFRVNSELRVLTVSGVIRPEDIQSDNTVLHDRMAEARISYGGRGVMTDLQSPRWGQEALDAILPF